MATLSEPASAQAFVHPGALDSEAEFRSISRAVASRRDPWAADFAKMRANPHDNLGWTPHPVAVVVRGAGHAGRKENYALLFNDTAAAYALALDWRVTGDSARADKAAAILNAWASTLQTVTGTSDKYLASGIYGYQLAIAAETLRGYPGWRRDAVLAFENMLLRVFYPMNDDFLRRHNNALIDHYWANWDLANIASMMAIGIFADRRDLYDEAKAYYLDGAGNGAIRHAAWKIYPDEDLAQWQESGRDQGHALLGLGLAGTICELAWRQGDDLFSAYDNLLLKAANYVAKYNLGQNVPYTPFSNSDCVQLVISEKGRRENRPIWAQFYSHYVVRRGIAAPYVAAMMQREGLEGGGGDYGQNSGGFDHLGYGTLTFLSPER